MGNVKHHKFSLIAEENITCHYSKMTTGIPWNCKIDFLTNMIRRVYSYHEQAKNISHQPEVQFYKYCNPFHAYQYM